MKALILLSLGRALQMLAAIAALRALTTALSAHEVGQYYWLSALLAISSTPLTTALASYYSRNLLEWSQAGLSWLQLRRISLLIVVVAWLAPLPIAALAAHRPGLSFVSVYLVLGATVFCGELSNLLISSLNIVSDRARYVAVSSFGALAKPGLAFVVARASMPTALGWLSGIAAGGLIAGLIALTLLRASRVFSNPKAPSPARPEFDFTSALTFMWPVSLGMVLYWGQTQANRLVIERIVSVEDLGTFAAAYAAGAGILGAFDVLFQQYFQPTFYRGLALQSDDAYRRTIQTFVDRLLPALIPVSLLTMFGARSVAWIFLGARFQSQFSLIAWAAGAESIRIISTTYYYAAIGRKQTSLLLPPAIAGAAGSICGTLVLGFAFGMQGLGAAQLLGALSTLTTFAVILRGRIALRLPWRQMLLAAVVCAPGAIAFLLLPSRLSKLSVSVAVCVAAACGISALHLVTKSWLDGSEQ